MVVEHRWRRHSRAPRRTVRSTDSWQRSPCLLIRASR